MAASTFQTSWAESVLRGLGAPVTPGNVQALVEWQAAEGGPTDNPLNTTLHQPGAQGASIKGYGSVQAGVNATVQTLKESAYAPVVNALKGNAGAGHVGAAVIASPWDGKAHYSGTDYYNKVKSEVFGQDLGPNTLPAQVATSGANAVSGLVGGISSVGDAIGWVFTNWLRVLEFLGGAVLGFYGLVLLGNSATNGGVVRAVEAAGSAA